MKGISTLIDKNTHVRRSMIAVSLAKVVASGYLVFVVDVQPLDHVQSTGHSLQHGNGIHFGQ